MASAFSCLMNFEQEPFEWHRVRTPAKDKHFLKLLDTAHDDVQIKTTEYLWLITREC
ncbi:hypothetical protein RO3G_01490 [Rhizopus delemar RA 99-880]|uniref:Uncharacterized protein n=1 Tax=Rhizopus delemar (strain RA 99-880 / ATCC MYA-4621 / FGSC 9543 / NRRL 43880) TaxID=246409 RepID=I1BKQ6_RHIO9|nr:hypothetical protein RO3G_01490 [Rhizopus delemar RA 99-880]|eukprot:EIE76786.1 hypothetical protein RO3G_01490 [Rhizopus delemar RA 99-880]